MKIHLELNGYSFRSGVWMCTSTWNHNAYKLPACIFKQCLSSLCTNFSFNIYFFSSSRPFLSPFSLFPTSFHTYLFFFPEHSDAFSVFFFKYYFFLRDEVFFYWNVHKVLQIQHYCKGSYLENNTAVCANTDFFPPLELAIICWALSTHSTLCNIKKEEDGISAPKGLQSVRCTKQIR